jgi:hypothetical protein
MTFSSLKSTTVRLALAICTLGLAVTLSGCGTGGGVRIGGGTATGAVAGGIYSLATQDGGRGALIGTGVGMFADLLNGQPPLEVEPYYGERRPVYHGYQGYQPDYRDYQRDYPRLMISAMDLPTGAIRARVSGASPLLRSCAAGCYRSND